MRDRPDAHRPWQTLTVRYGWRLWALPVLIVATIVAVVHIATEPGDGYGVPAAARARTAVPRPVSGGHELVEGLTGGASSYRPVTEHIAQRITLTKNGTTCLTSSYRQEVIVSIHRQHLWVCDGRRQIASTAVTTGAVVDHDQTPLGSWYVQAKQRDRYLVGPGYRDYVEYWIPFNGDFGLHDASWQTMPFGSPGWRTQGSHGCVHLPTRMMAWLYHRVSVGRTVVTIEA